MDVFLYFHFGGFENKNLSFFYVFQFRLLYLPWLLYARSFGNKSITIWKERYLTLLFSILYCHSFFFPAEAFMNTFVFCSACLPVYTCFSYFTVIPYKRENNKQFGSLVTSTNWYKIYFPIFFLSCIWFYFKDSVW